MFGTGTVASPNVQAGTAGTVYTNAATDADVNDTLTYSLDAASVTAGFSVSSAGVVSASSSVAAGTYSVIVSVTDGTASDTETVSIVIDAATPPAPSTDATAVFTVNGTAKVTGDTINVAAGTTSVTVVATPTDSNATAVVSGATGLVTGNNTVTVVVTAQDGTTAITSTFTVVVAAPVVTPPAPANTVAGTPTGVTATAGNATATVTWTAPTSNGGAAVSDYVIEYSNDSGATWTTFAHTASTATTATITGLVNGKAYTFRIKAVNSVGNSAVSTVSSAVTPIAPVVEPVAKSASDRTTFANNSTSLSAKQKAGLRAYFETYVGAKSLTIQVIGYAKSSTSTKASIAAATARAKAIAAFIKTLGIDATVTTKIVSKGTKAQAVFNLKWVE